MSTHHLPPPRHVLWALEQLDGRIGADLQRLVRADLPGLRGSHGRILDLIADDGSRPSALAAGSRITKQAVGQRIRELEQLGWVTVSADPADGRAVLVRRTAVGDRVRHAARRGIEAMEREWADAVGADRYDTFRQVLDELGRRPAGGDDG